MDVRMWTKNWPNWFKNGPWVSWMNLIWSKNGVSYLCLVEYLIQNEKCNKAEYVQDRVHRAFHQCWSCLLFYSCLPFWGCLTFFWLSSFLRLSSFSYLPILHTVWNISLAVVGCHQPTGICRYILSCLHFWGCLSFLDCLKLWSSPFLRSSSFLWLSSFLRPSSIFT